MSPTSFIRQDVHFNTEGSHFLLIGGGPRTIIQTNSEILFMLLYRSHFDRLTKLGARYQITTTIVEKQSILGVGGSFCGGQTGMMNSGIEDDVVFPLPLPSQSEDNEALKMFLSYRQRYDYMLASNKKEYYNEVKKVNVPGAVMFKRSVHPMSATLDGKLNHDQAYLMRRTVGEEEFMTFDKIKQLASSIPFYKLQIRNSSLVSRIAIRKEGQHIAVAQNIRTGTLDFLFADQIRLNTGTTATNPIRNPLVRQFAFCQVMNAVEYRNHCATRGLLDRNNLLKPGTKILSGGMGLSGLDQISVLDHVMTLFEEDESELLGYKVTDEAKKKYKGAITFLSRTVGKVIPPRHAFNFEWLQGTPVMGGTKHLHSLFLHGAGEEVFSVWTDILAATIARATNRTPDQVTRVPKTIEAVLRSQYEETKWFLKCRLKATREEKRGNKRGKDFFLNESSRTVYGAWRQAALSLIFGFGLEEDGLAAQSEMRSFAPITWKGREVWLFHRSQVAGITDPQFASHVSNMSYFNNWSEIMRNVTSSPVEIQSMFQLLFEAGIAKHVKASYSEIISDGSKLQLKDEEYDSLVISPVFSRNENEVVRSLAGQVMAYDKSKPTFGKVGKFRRFFDGDGNPVSVEDNGLGGKGFDIEAEDGGRSRIGGFATDINNRASGVSNASSFTLRRMAMAHLSAAGLKNPERLIDEIYEKIQPSEESYDEEVRKFQVFFKDAFEMWAYLEAIKFASGDDEERFRILFDAGLTRFKRKREMQKMEMGLTVERNAFAVYKDKIQKTPLFNPPSRDEYLGRFVDTTDDEDMLMYNEACDMAKKHLEQKQMGFARPC